MADADQSLVITGRVGHADFLNGQYDLQEEKVDGKPVYLSQHEIPEGYDEATGYQLYLYFHDGNDAWVISHALNSLDVIAFAPAKIKAIWHVANGKGAFVPDPTVKLVAASNGQVLTQLGPWTVEPDGEVALKKEDEGAGSERPMTVLELLRGVAERFPDARAMASQTPQGDWSYRTFSELEEEVNLVARAFCKLGLQEYHSVLVIGTNSAEWSVATLAAIAAGGIATSLYEHSHVDQIHFTADHSRADIIVVDSGALLERVMEAKARLPGVKAVVQYLGYPDTELADDPNALFSWGDLISLGRDVPANSETGQLLEYRQANLRANKCAALLYTQGTSTDPKPVMLSHDNITWTARAVAQAMGAEPARDTVVSYLPLANATVQMMDIWVPLASVSTVYFGPPNPLDRLSVIQTLKAVHPTLFLGVPFVWERFMELCQNTKRLSVKASRIGVQGSIRLQRGESVNRKFKSADKKTFGRLKRSIGLDNCRLAMCTDNNLPARISEYFLSINLPIFETYGSAECSGFHTISMPGTSRPASAGKCFPGAQVRMTHGEHEILFFGRHVTMGYLYDPDATAEAIDERGWYHSRDIGQADRSGFLYITSRKSDLVMTASGTAVPPQAVEANIKNLLEGLAEDIILVGHKRKELGVLITLKAELDEHYVPTEKLAPSALEVLKDIGSVAATVPQCINGAHAEKLSEHILSCLDKANAKVATDAQKVTKFQILPRGFSRRNGELGPLYKPNRRFIVHRYADVIETMYAGEVVDDYEEADWYHGPISRNDTSSLLKRDSGGWDGWHLVRLSTKEKNTFIITLCFKGKLFHNQIKYADGVYNTHKDQGNHQYNSLQELVNHHKEGKHGFQVMLTKPCPRPK